MTPLFMHAQNILTSNITTVVSTSKLVTFTTHISPHMATLPTALPNHSHSQNFKNSQLIWACTMTFQLEGGCWSQVGKFMHYCPRQCYCPSRGHTSQWFVGPCGHKPTPSVV